MQAIAEVREVTAGLVRFIAEARAATTVLRSTVAIQEDTAARTQDTAETWGAAANQIRALTEAKAATMTVTAPDMRPDIAAAASIAAGATTATVTAPDMKPDCAAAAAVTAIITAAVTVTDMMTVMRADIAATITAVGAAVTTAAEAVRLPEVSRAVLRHITDHATIITTITILRAHRRIRTM